MECYKLIIEEGTPGVGTSTVLKNLMNELFSPGKSNINPYFEFFFEEKNDYPKESYFYASKQAIIDKIQSKYKLIPTVYSDAEYLENQSSNKHYQHLGGANVF